MTTELLIHSSSSFDHDRRQEQDPSRSHSGANPLREDCTRDAAADHPVTYDQLDHALGQIQHALEPQLNSFYEEAWLQGGEQNHLVDTPDGVFFGFTPTMLYNREEISDLDLDKDTFKTVRDAHQNQAEIWGFDVDRPTSYADTYVDDFYPFYIQYPDNWLEAQYHATLRMKRLLTYNLTPAEALDFWALEDGTASLDTNREQQRWHGIRDVGREAVNKTLRQARDKLTDPDNQPYHEKQDIKTTEID